MADAEYLEMLKKGVEFWNKWRKEDLEELADPEPADLRRAELWGADLRGVDFTRTDLTRADLRGTKLGGADLRGTDLSESDLSFADLRGANLEGADLRHAILQQAILEDANLIRTRLEGTYLKDLVFLRSRLVDAEVGGTIFANSDLSQAIGLEDVFHVSPSSISIDTLVRSKGRVPEIFLRDCGLSDWEIESAKLYSPDLSNHEINDIQYRMYELRATQALQISPLFVSYSHADSEFVDKIGDYLNKKGIRYWRDIHDMKAGRREKQIDRAIRQNPTVLMVISKNSLTSDWVEHEVRTARDLEKELGRDVLCPVALDDSWKSSSWPKRIMEQIKEYNILDFSAWKDDVRFDGMFRKLIDGLELFYKG
jgi:hypothetical protein